MDEYRPGRWGKVWRYTIASLCTLLFFTVPTGWSMPLAVTAHVAALGAALYVIRFRFARPVVVAVGLLLACLVIPATLPFAAWAYLSLCTRRRWWATVLVGVLQIVVMARAAITANAISVDAAPLASGVSEAVLRGLFAVAFSTLFTVALGAIGSYLGSRRAEAVTMQARLDMAEREALLVERESRAEERNRIAREMHDVVAHKISLISMHAGALAYRDDLSPDEIKQAAHTIQESSHQALSELRVILGQLRQKEGDDVLPPQPSLAVVGELVDAQRAAGRSITYTNSLEGEPSTTVSRQGYRIVQEALTNAAKHAPGTPVTVDLAGGPDAGVSIRVVNPLSLAAPRADGARVGLIGLDERVDTVGGRFHAGADGAGQFVVEVWMPW